MPIKLIDLSASVTEKFWEHSAKFCVFHQSMEFVQLSWILITCSTVQTIKIVKSRTNKDNTAMCKHTFQLFFTFREKHADLQQRTLGWTQTQAQTQKGLSLNGMRSTQWATGAPSAGMYHYFFVYNSVTGKFSSQTPTYWGVKGHCCWTPPLILAGFWSKYCLRPGLSCYMVSVTTARPYCSIVLKVFSHGRCWLFVE